MGEMSSRVKLIAPVIVESELHEFAGIQHIEASESGKIEQETSLKACIKNFE